MPLKILIASTDDRDGLVEEVWIDETYVAEVRRNGSEVDIDFYCGDNVLASARLSDLIQALQVSEKRMREDLERVWEDNASK